MDNPQNPIIRRNPSSALNGRPPPSLIRPEKITHIKPLFISMRWTTQGPGKAWADLATNWAHVSSSGMSIETAQSTERATPLAGSNGAKKSRREC